MTDTLNELSEALFMAKEVKQDLNNQIKSINEEIRGYEHQIWELMNEDKNNPLMKFATSHGTIYLSPQIVPKVVD